MEYYSIDLQNTQPFEGSIMKICPKEEPCAVYAAQGSFVHLPTVRRIQFPSVLKIAGSDCKRKPMAVPAAADEIIVPDTQSLPAGDFLQSIVFQTAHIAAVGNNKIVEWYRSRRPFPPLQASSAPERSR